MSKHLFLVERLVVEYQYIVADSAEEAVEDAVNCGEWDRETLTEGDDLSEIFYGVRATPKGEP